MTETKEKRVPKLRFPEFKSEWKSFKIGKIGKPSMCKRIMKDQTLNDGDIPFYKIGTFGKEADAYISNDLYIEYKTKFSFPKKGDVLISASGTIGRTVVYDGEPAFFQDSNIVWIANNEEKVLNELLVYLYENVRWTTENTTIARLYNDNLKNISITIPNLPEQQKIASFLSAVDQKINQLQRKKVVLQAYKKGMMQQFFSQQIRFKDESGNDFPEWEEKKLGDISNKVGYGIASSAKEFDGENQYLRITDIDEHTHKFEPKPLTSPEGKIDSRYYLQEGDLVFARTGASVGKSYLYKKNDGRLIYAGFLIKFSIKNANPNFVFYKTLTSEYNKWVQIMSMRSGQPGLNAEELKSLEIELPCKEEQTKIATFLSALDDKIDTVSTAITQTQDFKKGLLQQMFV